MVFRLLYRLLLQRVHQGSSRQRELETAPALVHRSRQTAYTTKQQFFGWSLAISLILAGSLVLGWRYTKHILYDQSVEAVDRTSLKLQVFSSRTWPVVVYLGGDDLPPHEANSARSSISRITSINGSFAPAFQVLSRSSVLEIVNSDPIAHNTHVFNRGDTIFNVGLPLPGITVKKNLTGTGIFSVRCDLHASMQAWLFVPPNRHFAVLHEPKTVRFLELPPGDYVLHRWHPDGAERLRLVSLAAGETKTLYLR